MYFLSDSAKKQMQRRKSDKLKATFLTWIGRQTFTVITNLLELESGSPFIIRTMTKPGPTGSKSILGLGRLALCGHCFRKGDLLKFN